MIVASIGEAVPALVLERMDQARLAGADIAEVCIDRLICPNKTNLHAILAARVLPTLISARPRWEGGRWGHSEAERIELLREASRHADYIDIELRAEARIPRDRAAIVVSYHDFAGVPADLDGIIRRMMALQPDVLKVAATAACAIDLVRLVKLQRRLAQPAVVIAMGEQGRPLRILSRRYSVVWTYASCGPPTAPGQLSVSDLVLRHRFKSINEATSIYALFGSLASGAGLDLLDHALQEAGLNARCVGVPIQDVVHIRPLLEVFDARGAAIEPCLQPAVPAILDQADELVTRLGSADTIWRRGRTLAGTNALAQTSSSMSLQCLARLTAAQSSSLWRRVAGLQVAAWLR